jgi:hypothetical protein
MVILIFSFKPSGFRSAGVKRGFQFWFWNEFDDTIRGCVFQIFSGSYHLLWHTKESPPAMDIVTRSMEFGLAQRMRLHPKKPSYG